MTVSRVVVETHARQVLGEDGIAVACAQLWPVDCVACGQPLGAEPPELRVAKASPGFSVALCHVRCALSIDETTLRYGAVSWRVTAYLDTEAPLVLLNPSAERVRLYRTDDGWQVRPDVLFPNVGLTMSGPESVVRRTEPLRIEPMRLTATQFEVRIGGERYTGPVNPELAGIIRRHDGCILIITHGWWVDSGLTEEDVARLVHEGQAAIGWAGIGTTANLILTVALDAVTAAAAGSIPQRTVDDGPVLLRLSPGERAVVELVASSRLGSDAEAQDWAEQHLPPGFRPLPWREWAPEGTAHRWGTYDALTGAGYELAVDGHDARLYRHVATGRRTDGTGDADAIAWARLLLRRSSDWTELASTGRTRWFAEVAS
jgi:hypothetical protein